MSTLIRSALLVKYSEIARTIGVDPERMIHHVGADRSCIVSPDLHVPEPWLAKVLDSTEQSSSCAAVGLLMAESWRLSDFGPISLALQHQPTLRHALGQLETYRHLLSESVFVHVEEVGETAIVRQQLITERPIPGRQPVELSVGALLCLMKSMLGGSWKPRSVHFSHSAPASLHVHHRLFGTRVEFGCDFDGIVVDRRDLDRPNPLGDVNLARYAREFLDQHPHGRQVSTASNVRRAVHMLLPRGQGSIDQVGQQLGMSSRTLQRRLEQEGLEFSSLVNEVRRGLACRFLGDIRYPVSQVAMLVGFAEVSTFSRWFSAQFGTPPTRWRAETNH
ncbi:HTH-type transcriptional regulator VirS [Cupriavidus yeoncheonensis]|uniref:HTH-type transcriptional regulator VirS n=1 Tax=Cupriavidus yeoncheonensis TaxID=1462994 RepID=A0A916NFK0_9BURK|nr:AraC family transcriptional regulator [Cupriavidus yeoncheonensis]CAG2154674.1 HTH-type transcriptional regulator VirS [Cupriavidus yeoncheonensis]